MRAQSDRYSPIEILYCSDVFAVCRWTVFGCFSSSSSCRRRRRHHRLSNRLDLAAENCIRDFTRRILIHDVLVAFRSARQLENCGRACMHWRKKANSNSIEMEYLAFISLIYLAVVVVVVRILTACISFYREYSRVLCAWLWNRCMWTESIHANILGSDTWHNIHSKFTARKIFLLNFKISYSSSFGWDARLARILLYLRIGPIVYGFVAWFKHFMIILWMRMENNTRK